MANKPAPFISFEGGEGSGKTTQIAKLREWLEGRGFSVHTTREPGGTEGGKLIRKLVVEGDDARWSPKTETLLYMADRCDHLDKIIRPKTAEGTWVLTDRFVDSSYAYQSYGRGIPLNEIQSVYEFFGKGFMPDMTLLLDIDPELGLTRAMTGKGRNLNEVRFEKIGLEFHQKLRNGYLDMARKDSARYEVITITADKTPDAIHAEIVQRIQKRFELS